MPTNNDNDENNARGGALLILTIGAITLIVVSLVVAFLVEAGYINLQ